MPSHPFDQHPGDIQVKPRSNGLPDFRCPKEALEDPVFVFWVDADSVFLQHADFKEFVCCDFAVRVNEFLPKDHPSRIAANTLFVRNSAEGIALLEKWCREGESALHETKDLRFMSMPLKYAKIYDYDDLFISKQETVIEHFQASRRNRNKIHDLCQNHCCH